jgi:hypothetical protein
MNLFTILLWLPVAEASPPTAAVGIGSTSMVLDECANPGPTVQAEVLWHLPGFELGPIVQGSAYNYCSYQESAEMGLTPTAPGDFRLLGVGAVVSMPALFEWRVLRIGAHGYVLGEDYASPMDPSYFEEALDEQDFSNKNVPTLGLSAFLIRTGVGGDIGFALAARRPAPELVFSLDVAYDSGFGLVIMPTIGMRVGAGG